MERIGVRELKEHMSEILRRVREEQGMYEITFRGRAVARLVPVVEPVTAASPDAFWAELDRVAEEIGSRWPTGVTAVEAIREQRRELC
jgi:prevent-host-death family protein